MPAEIVLPTATAMPKPTPRICRSAPFPLRGERAGVVVAARESEGVDKVGLGEAMIRQRSGEWLVASDV